jgi:ABC-2 type transport system ATP-binding protein
MDEAQYLADRVAVIAAGRLVAEGPPGSIGGRDSGRSIIAFTLPEGAQTSALPPGCRVEGRSVTIETAEPTRTLHALTGWALDRDIALAGLTVTQRSLEDIYLELVGHRVQP